MKLFRCVVCGYETDERSHVNVHHIVPKSMGGEDSSHNTVVLCPNCHARVYVDGCVHCMHSVRGGDSIVIGCWRNGGLLLEWKRVDSDEFNYASA